MTTKPRAARNKKARPRPVRARQRASVGRSKAMAFLEELAEEPLTLGGLMKAIRQGEGWTLEEMGKKLGASRGFVSNVENGAKTVSPKAAARYAEILGHSPDQFVRLALQGIVDREGMKYTVKLANTA